MLRYTPLPTAVLKQVAYLSITANDLNTGGRTLPLHLWNWSKQAWEDVNVFDQTITINDPARFLGPQNAVQMRLVADEIGGYVRIGHLSITRTGTY